MCASARIRPIAFESGTVSAGANRTDLGDAAGFDTSGRAGGAENSASFSGKAAKTSRRRARSVSELYGEGIRTTWSGSAYSGWLIFVRFCYEHS